MRIPDPTELLEMRMERMIDQYEEGCCMDCGKKVGYELIQVSPDPCSPVVCYDCLSPESKEAYDKFCASMEKS